VVKLTNREEVQLRLTVCASLLSGYSSLVVTYEQKPVTCPVAARRRRLYCKKFGLFSSLSSLTAKN